MSNITDPLARMTALVTFGMIVSIGLHIMWTGEVNVNAEVAAQVSSYLTVAAGAANAVVRYFEER